MKRTINIPLGATIRVKREDGSSEKFVFRGSDAQGVIYEARLCKRHADVAGYLDFAMKEDAGWKLL